MTDERTHPHLEGLIPEIKRELLQAYVSGEHGLEYAITEAAQRIAALAALPGGGVDEIRAALQQIASLDYSRAATNGVAYQAVHIAKTALYRDSLPTPSPHEADRND